MFATDFLFDGQRASDFGCMICSFDGNTETASCGEIEYNVVKAPDNDIFTFYGSQFNSTIVWNFSICKNPCVNSKFYFNQYEESMIAKWLIKTDGYRWLQFEQDGYEDIFYKVYVNMLPHQTNGRTVGFDLTVTSNCAYGFSNIIKQYRRIDSDTKIKFNVYSDINTYILPTIKIIRGSSMIGDFSINNFSDDLLEKSVLNKPIIFKNIQGNLTVNSDTETIDGLSTPDDFNWSFLRLVDGVNIITTDSEIGFGIEIQYREPRFIRI